MMQETKDSFHDISNWTLGSFAVFGVACGFFAGLSEEPIVHVLLPILFGVIGGASGLYINSSDFTKESTVHKLKVIGKCSAVFGAFLILSMIYGIFVRTGAPLNYLYSFGSSFDQKESIPIPINDSNSALQALELRARIIKGGANAEEANKIINMVFNEEIKSRSNEIEIIAIDLSSDYADFANRFLSGGFEIIYTTNQFNDKNQIIREKSWYPILRSKIDKENKKDLQRNNADYRLYELINKVKNTFNPNAIISGSAISHIPSLVDISSISSMISENDNIKPEYKKIIDDLSVRAKTLKNRLFRIMEEESLLRDTALQRFSIFSSMLDAKVSTNPFNSSRRPNANAASVRTEGNRLSAQLSAPYEINYATHLNNAPPISAYSYSYPSYGSSYFPTSYSHSSSYIIPASYMGYGGNSHAVNPFPFF